MFKINRVSDFESVDKKKLNNNLINTLFHKSGGYEDK